MKISWGTGIVIAIVAFMSFILVLVVSMSTSKKFDYDLVTEKYYQQELVFQDKINAEKNALIFKDKITFTKTEKGLEIQFPDDFETDTNEGKVFLYRPSNKQLDFEIPISETNTYLLVPEKRLVDGRWNINIVWSYKNTDYLFKKELIY